MYHWSYDVSKATTFAISNLKELLFRVVYLEPDAQTCAKLDAQGSTQHLNKDGSHAPWIRYDLDLLNGERIEDVIAN